MIMEPKGKKVYTIDDIARELGVSKTTVSRAISGKGRIGQTTREKVLSFIEEHDYRPNVMAKGLAQRKTFNLALLLPKDYAVTEFPFFKDCMQGICEMASSHDYDVIISMIDGDDLSQLQRLEVNRKVDGMILSRAVEHSKAQEYLKSCKEPFVVIGPEEDTQIVYVDNKNLEASEELASIMLMKGVQKLALLGGNESFSVTKSRYQGYVQAHEKMGRQVHTELIFMDCENQLKVSGAVRQILEAGADGILCMDDAICTMCIESLRELKVQISSGIRVASLYDSKSLEYNNPPITSVKFDTVRLGKMAAGKLLKMLGEELQEDMQPLNYQVVLRESTQ